MKINVKKKLSAEGNIIMRDHSDLCTDDEIFDVEECNQFLLEQEQNETERFCSETKSKTLKCPKCDGPNEPSNFNCVYCGHQLRKSNRLQEERFLRKSDSSSSQAHTTGTTNIVLSVFSFILTTIIRFCVDKKSDLTPEAWSHHWGMVVPNNIKPFVLIVPVIFTLLTITKTVNSDTMSKKGKILSYIYAIGSLLASIGIVNMKFEL